MEIGNYFTGETGHGKLSSPSTPSTNTLSFTAYRMIVTSQRGVDRCTQFSEMHLYKILSTNLSLFH